MLSFMPSIDLNPPSMRKPRVSKVLGPILAFLLLLAGLYLLCSGRKKSRFRPLTNSNRVELESALPDLADYTKEQERVLQFATRDQGWLKLSSKPGVFIFPANPQLGITRNWKISKDPATLRWQIEDPPFYDHVNVHNTYTRPPWYGWQ